MLGPGAQPDVWGPSFGRGQSDWGERPPPLPSRASPLAWLGCLFWEQEPLPRQARSKRKGVWLGRWGPLRGGSVGAAPPCPCCGACTLAGCGFRTLMCVGRVASLIEDTGGPDGDECVPVSPPHVLLQPEVWGASVVPIAAPLCVCVHVRMRAASPPLASVFYLSPTGLGLMSLAWCCPLVKDVTQRQARGCFPCSHCFQKRRRGGLSHGGSWWQCGSPASPGQGCA